MHTWDDFYGPNAGYVLELYERYRNDPDAVDAATRAFFDRLAPEARQALEQGLAAPKARPSAIGGEAPLSAAPALRLPSASAAADPERIVAAARLARGIREYGHLQAAIDPLAAIGSSHSRPGDPMLDPATHGLTDDDLRQLPASIIWPNGADGAPEDGRYVDALERLRAIYTGPLGYDFDHVQDFTERAWLVQAVESGQFAQPLAAGERRGLLRRLTEVEAFERFLHTTFPGQKRFSIEGTDALVPMLDALIHDAAAAGTREVLIGMAHRGRLNVLAHVLGKPYRAIFSEFHTAPNKELVPSEGSMGINYGWTGDVKYHLGAQRLVREGELVQIRLTMAHNPSHLEFVNPVVQGFARAAQDRRSQPGEPRQDRDAALAITIHGDAAFPGEGVVAETLNLSRLPGYSTGGTIRIIANNQIGFTTEASDARSTLYAGDLAKGFEIPIVHVNADEPEACLAAVRLAHAYRERFHKDFLVDLVGYRRWGHNEGDEPAFTQPQMYAAITSHPTVRALYAQWLEQEGIVSQQDADAMESAAREVLRAAYEALSHGNGDEEQPALRESPPLERVPTAVPAATLRALNDALLASPEGFASNSKLERLLLRRRERLDQPQGIDWAHAEALAFASLLADGTPIRLSGQDTERGTFSQRHLVLHDGRTGRRFVPLQALPQARASVAVYNSPLSETAPLGFEYGYSVHAPETLVLWEAQYGDFANAGQVIIDQFIAAARAKWRQHPGLVLLLPHSYEGQGPEHSSARVERYLQLAAEDNLRIANCTTAAQYFHLLRAQSALRGDTARPLMLMTPKGLLRHPLAGSSLNELATGGFQPVLDDARSGTERDEVRRLLVCSGKVAIDLLAAAPARNETPSNTAILRLELLYPFPGDALQRVVARYPTVKEVVWVQEEPRNMGAWVYVEPRLREMVGDHTPLRYVGRPERAATAEGQAEMHAAEQARILEAALGSDAAQLASSDAPKVASPASGAAESASGAAESDTTPAAQAREEQHVG